MTPEDFFQGKLTGWGVVRSRFGRVLRRFTLEMEGRWSQEHRALHLDETYSYVGGDTHQRRWAIHTDEQGFILGHDALEVARMRGRQHGDDFHVVFDRLHQPGGPMMAPVQIVRFVEIAPGRSLMLGEIKRFKITIATLHAAVRRVD